MTDMRSFWNDEYATDPEHTRVDDRILEAEIDGLAPGSALDLGCGSGENVLMLAARGWTVVGVDFAERAIELARKAAKASGLDATFVVADTISWVPTGTFDLVFSAFALPHGDDARSVVEKAARVLAPGGTLLIAEGDRSMAAVWHFPADELVTVEDLTGWLKGLEIEKAEVRQIEAFAENDPRGEATRVATVALVRARRLPRPAPLV